MCFCVSLGKKVDEVSISYLCEFLFISLVSSSIILYSFRESSSGYPTACSLSDAVHFYILTRWKAGGKHKVYLYEFLFVSFHFYLKNFTFWIRVNAWVRNSLITM